jgi:hypothetical protein
VDRYSSTLILLAIYLTNRARKRMRGTRSWNPESGKRKQLGKGFRVMCVLLQALTNLLNLPTQSDEDDIPLRTLVGKTSKVTGSSDDEEPLSASLQRPTAFKETGLLQPVNHGSEVVAVSPSQ